MCCHMVRYFCVNVFDCFALPLLVNILKFQLSFNFFLCKFQLYLLSFFAFTVFNNWEKFARISGFSFCSSLLNTSFSLHSDFIHRSALNLRKNALIAGTYELIFSFKVQFLRVYRRKNRRFFPLSFSCCR